MNILSGYMTQRTFLLLKYIIQILEKKTHLKTICKNVHERGAKTLTGSTF